MKSNILLLVGLGVPSDLTEALIRAGMVVQRPDTPMAAALSLLRNDVGMLLVLGDVEPEWSDVVDAAAARGELLQIENLLTVQESLVGRVGRNGSNGSNGSHSANGSHGHASDDDYGDAGGMTLEEVVARVQESMERPATSFDHIYTKVGNKLRKVELDDVLYIEVEGKYSALQVNERKYNVKASLKDLLQKLPNDRFVRVSRNFVVNLSRIQHIDTFQYTVKVGDVEIPISRTYKEELMRRINLI
jgi:molybdopterin converting factor small subunit